MKKSKDQYQLIDIVKNTIENFLTVNNNDEIEKIVSQIGLSKLTPTSHLYPYKDFAGKLINEAATIMKEEFANKSIRYPSIAIIEVVLAANRDYNNMVRDVIIRLEKNTEFPKSIENCEQFLRENLHDFYEDYVISRKSFAGRKAVEIFTFVEQDFIKNFLQFNEVNHKKMLALFEILIAIKKIRVKVPETLNSENDFEVMKWWATIYCKKECYIGDVESTKKLTSKGLLEKRSNIADATIQHLRMRFGADTLKPDQRVKEVLLYNFLKLDKEVYFAKHLNNNDFVYKMVNKILLACKLNPSKIYLDSMFVNYGSGYYNRNNDTATVIEDVVTAFVKKLKEKGVSDEIIEFASGYSKSDLHMLLEKLENKN